MKIKIFWASAVLMGFAIIAWTASLIYSVITKGHINYILICWGVTVFFYIIMIITKPNKPQSDSGSDND